MMPRLLLADRVKGPRDSFLVPLLPALRRHYDVRFVSLPPGDALAQAIGDADIVWLEWCWDHAVWATQSGALHGKPCILRLHSIEALQTDFPARTDWSQVTHLITVGDDIAALLQERFPAIAGAVPISIVPNGIDLNRFAAGDPDRYRIAWVGHVEPKKNPMLLLQIAHAVHLCDARFSFHVAGPCTDVRTLRYTQRLVPALGLNGAIRFYGPVADMPAWYADKGVLLSTTMYESFGMNIGEAMAVGAFPVVHDFPGADLLWPTECLFSSIEEAVALIRSARPGLYRDWVAQRYALEHQEAAVLRVLDQAAAGTRTVQAAPERA
ncbi:MAG TPA: glycosyltransferase family 4 protein [Acetobacteraceae bacterium]|jgi:glycosyltransferase involved in cell wall biosynthesis